MNDSTRSETARRSGSPPTPGPLTHLHDRGNDVARRYGLAFSLPEDLRTVYRGFGLDLAKAHGDDTWTLPMPARFVIDGAGLIRAADVDPDDTQRTEPAETIAVPKTLAASRRS